MSFRPKIQAETDLDEEDCTMEPPLSPVFPSESNGKKMFEEVNRMSPAGENSKNLFYTNF